MKKFKKIECGSNLLHNMSAPPRMTIKMKALPIPQENTGGQPRGVCLLGIIRLKFIFMRVLRRREIRGINDFRRKFLLAAERLANLKTSSAKVYNSLSEEELFDRFSFAIRRVPLPEKFPAFGHVVQLSGEENLPTEYLRKEILDPKWAVGLISRVSGTLFLCERPPHLPPESTLQNFFAFFSTNGGAK